MNVRTILIATASTAFGLCFAMYFANQTNAKDNEAGANREALEQQLKVVLKERARSANYANEATRTAYEAETVDFDALADSFEKLADAEVDLATTPKEKIAALESNVDRTKKVELLAKMQFDAGKRGGEANRYYSAKRNREAAEIRLLKFRIKAKL